MAWAIQSNLFELPSIVEHVSSAVALFQFSTGQRIAHPGAGESEEDRGKRHKHNDMLRDWKMMAAKAGAIKIYEFHRLEQAIDAMLKKCPTLEAMLDLEARKRAARLFHDTFPNFADVRDVAAHGAEIFDNPDKVNRHATRGEIYGLPNFMIKSGDGKIVGRDLLVESTYSAVFEGKQVSYNLSDATVATLHSVCTERMNMFAPAQRATREILMKRLTEARAQPSSDQSSRL